MAIPRKPLVDRLLLMRKTGGKTAYPQISCKKTKKIIFSICHLGYLIAMRAWLFFICCLREWARFYSLLLFSSLQCCVCIRFSTKWCADCRSRGFGSYGFPCNLSLYRYIVETAGAIGGCWAVATELWSSLTLSLSRFLALLFDTLFNHRLYTVTAAADGRSAFVLFSGPRRFFVIFCLHPFLAALHKEYSCTLLLWPRSFLMDSFPFFLCFLWLLFIVRTRLHYRTFFFFPFFTGLPAAHPPCALTVDVRIEKKIDTAIDWCGWLLDEIPRETCVSKR